MWLVGDGKMNVWIIQTIENAFDCSETLFGVGDGR